MEHLQPHKVWWTIGFTGWQSFHRSNWCSGPTPWSSYTRKSAKTIWPSWTVLYTKDLHTHPSYSSHIGWNTNWKSFWLLTARRRIFKRVMGKDKKRKPGRHTRPVPNAKHCGCLHHSRMRKKTSEDLQQTSHPQTLSTHQHPEAKMCPP